METDTPKTTDQTTVRIMSPTKERIQNVVRKKAARDNRRVTEVEVADQILKEGLPAMERELGIESKEE